MDKRTRIGGTHARDFDNFRTQVPLVEVPVHDAGYVRFVCLTCPRTGKVAAAGLRARFAPTGLVNILSILKPKDCPEAPRDPLGNPRCGWCYRDLAKPSEG